ncbi:MAG TPA: alpha-2-macroglobulin family protein, partial [Candidatus Gracilibacteria bacterium]|nr:alpha-2-macroglobulin family protein [Candidatus Gracilibacteria bacterium]
SPFKTGKILVSKEQERLMKTYWVDLKTNAQTLEIPIEEEDIPNVYLSVILYKGRDAEIKYDAESEKDLSQPQFKVGYIKIPVQTKAKKLNIQITPQKKIYHPQSEVKIKLKVNDWKNQPVENAELTAMVVDMSLLALTGYEAPDLISAFYGEKGLGIKTALSMAKFIERYRPGAKGGDGGEGKARGVFKNTAFWTPKILTNAQGEAELKFVLPDNLTEWKVTVLAHDDKQRFGSETTSFIEQKTLAMTAVLPAVFRVNDQNEIGLSISNQDQKTQNVQLGMYVNDEKDQLITQADLQSFSLAAGEMTTRYFPLKLQAKGNVKLKFVAQGQGAEDILLETRMVENAVS